MKKRARAKKQLELGQGLTLPGNAVTQTLAFLARRGAGKTYAAMRLCEQMLSHDAQVIIVDPVGVWWGLRLDQKGNGPSDFEIPVLGGLHGDISLSAEGGAHVAEALIEHSSSAVLDVSLLSKRKMRQFLTDFGERFLLLKKRLRSPVHLFLEEAQEVVPQRVVKGGERLFGAFESIIKLGRNFGIGASLISQRPQAVNKDVLNQAELLVVLQLTGPHERRAIRGWIQDQGANGAELEARLPKLQTGQAIVWSPAWLQIYKEVRILKKVSFDASSTPKLEDLVDAPKVLKPLDLFALKDSIEKLSESASPKDKRPTTRRSEEAALLTKLQAAEERIRELMGQLLLEREQHSALVAGLEALLSEAGGSSKEKHRRMGGRR